MLLREFDQSDDFVANIENILKLYLQNYNKESSPGDIPYGAINDWLQGSGSYGSVNRKIIDDLKSQSPVLGSLIKNYDEKGITLNTDVDAPDDTAPAQPDLEKTDQGISKTTAQAASSAATAGLTDQQ
jgi:hypothetical protein